MIKKLFPNKEVLEKYQSSFMENSDNKFTKKANIYVVF